MQISPKYDLNYRKVKYENTRERDWVHPGPVSLAGARKVLENFGILKEPDFPQYAMLSERSLRNRESVLLAAAAQEEDESRYSAIERAAMQGLADYIQKTLDPQSDEKVRRRNGAL